ncbi:TPA: CDP-alcohol phosphatidyltransferase family protein [Candidatus Micrarchaeota archaeon]|nr:CDP-alcohol phosphatidyltransferase family protein [Candidatus Micrarchaeota archaeon]
MMLKEKLPDWLTAARGLIAAAILGMIPFGPEALSRVIALLLLGWTTDMLDGRLARRYDKSPTWIGDHEFQFDMLMVFASAVYLIAVGLVPAWVGIPYLSFALLLAAWAYRTKEFLQFKALAMGLAFPWVFIPFIVAYFHARPAAYAGLVWMLVALVLDWKRFTGVVGDFLHGSGLAGR